MTGTQSYRLTPQGYRVCVLFLKLFHKVAAPLTSATLQPVPCTGPLPTPSPLDQLYAAVDRALNDLWHHVGLKLAA